MTGRLIDADAQIEQEKFFAETFKGDFGEQVALHTIEILKNAPTVDAIPVEWIREYTEENRLYQLDDFDLYIRDMIADWEEREEE